MTSKPIILFEGIDGAGKTYALSHLKEYYEKIGEVVHVVDSISYSTFLQSHDKEWFDLTNNNTRYMEYLSWQVNNYYKNIKPYIGKAIILIDRFIPSCYAYNTIDSDQFSRLWMEIMDKFAREFFIPDFTFYFAVDNEVLEARHKLTKQPEKMTDFKYLDFVKISYDNFFSMYGAKWHNEEIQGDRPIEAILTRMLTVIEEL